MPGREPISSIANLEALQAETDKIIGLIRSIQEAINNVSQANSLFKGAKGAAEQKAATDGLIQSNEQLLKVQKELDAEQQKSATLQTELAKQLAIKKELNKQAAIDMRAEAKEAAGLNDAYRKLELQYNAAQRAAKNLASTPGTPKQAIEEANSKAMALSQQLKAIDVAVGQHQRNVGNYTGALKTLERSLEETKNKMDGLTKAGKANTQQGRQLQEEIQTLGQLVGQQTNGFTSLSREVMATGKALETMAESGLRGTEAFQALEEQYIEARRELNEFRKSQQLLTSEAPVLKSLTIAAKGLGGVYATGAGAAALFADGNEKVEKELNKLVAVMTVLQGLNELHELIEKKGAIATTFSTAALKLKRFVLTGSTKDLKDNAAANIQAAGSEEVLATATTATSKSMQFLRGAIIATGIGALLILLPEIANAMSNLGKATEDTKEDSEELEKVNENMADSYAETLISVQKMKETFNEVGKGLVSQKDALEEYNQEFGDTIGSAESFNDAEQKFIDKAPAYVAAMKQRAIANAAFKLEQEALTQQIKEDASGVTGFLQKTDLFFTKLFEGSKEANEVRAAMVKENHDDNQVLIDQYANIADKAKEAADAIDKASGINTKGTNKKEKSKQEFTDYEEGFRQLREEFNKFRQEAFGIDVDAYTKELQTLLEKYQEGFIKINDVRDKDLQKIAENEKKGILTVKQAGAERVKIERDTAAARAQAEEAYYLNLNAIQEKHRQEIEAKKKAEDAKNIKHAIESQQKIAKALQADADAHFREQVTIAKNNQAAHPSFGNDKALAEAERQQAIANQTKLLDEKKITQQEFDSDMLAIQADYNKKVADAQVKEFTKYADMAKSAMDIVGSFEKAAEERKIKSIDRQIAAAQKMYDKERSNIENSTLNEQQKANAINVINQQQRNRDKQLQQEKHTAQVKEARFEQVKSIFEISTNTAIAIMEAVKLSPATGGLPWSAIAAGMGAAQIALVLSKPLPTFAKGTESAPVGWGIWGEAGQEAKIDRRGRIELSAGPSLTRFEGGERIIPHDELNRIMYNNMIQATASFTPSRRDESVQEIKRLQDIIREEGDRSAKAAKNQKAPRVTIKINPGWDAYIKKSVRE